MAIKISNLNLAGSDLFAGEESFLTDLQEADSDRVFGGSNKNKNKGSNKNNVPAPFPAPAPAPTPFPPMCGNPTPPTCPPAHPAPPVHHPCGY
jgi:hypothetical protein